MRKIIGLFSLICYSALSGCGGNTLYGPSSQPNNTTAQSMTLVTSTPQIPSDGSTSATITAYIQGTSNQFLADVPVNFSATSGGISASSTKTDKNGAAVITLSSATDPTNRRITVTATTGTVTKTIDVDVTGTQVTLSGPASLVQNNSGQYVVTLADAGGNGLANRAVTLASTRGNTITPAPTMNSDANGKVTYTVTAANAGVDTLTATALGLTATQTLAVSNDSFSITTPTANAKLNLGAIATVSATWVVSGTPQAGQVISFAATRGTLSSSTAVTNGAGTATITITSNAAGPAVITATTPTGITTQVQVNFIATNPASMILQASPTNVPITTQSTITAIVRDPLNNLVEGTTVDFTLVDITGGSLSVASALTDNQGRAQTIYTASSTTSASNAVVISAIVRGTAVTGQTTLTVGGRTVFLSLGTGNTIIEPTDTTYQINYTALALDASGNGLNGIPVSFTIHSKRYYKGFRSLFPLGCFTSCLGWTTTWTATCASEDGNLNGFLDIGEDFNASGKLEPGDVAAVSPGTTTTAGGGAATVKITYPQDQAFYVAVTITVTAVVQGSETSETATFVLPGSIADFNNINASPPGIFSPYGTSATCADTL